MRDGGEATTGDTSPATDAEAAEPCDPGAALNFFETIQNLKTTKRTGWVRKGITGPESIADHMYRMAMMAFIGAEDENVNQNKCVQMALAHDLAEAVVGDITPHDGVSKEDKARMERDAMKKMCEPLGSTVGHKMLELWEEYEAGSSPEALLLKDLDKLEMILQAFEYEKEQEIPLEEFFASTNGKFRTTTGLKWAAEVYRRRKALAAGAADKFDAKEDTAAEDAGGAKKQRVE